MNYTDRERWSGIGAVVPTPLNRSAVDVPALKRIVRRVADARVHMVWALGSGGEQPNLSRDQRREVLTAVAEEVHGEVPVVAGVGDCATAAVLDNIADAAEARVDAVQVIEPYFYPLRRQELLDHYLTVADASPLPVFIYHHPERWPEGSLSRTSLDGTLGRLSRHPNIVGIKDSVRDFRNHERLVFESRRPDFRVLVSAGRLLLASLLIGADGGVFHEASVAPLHFVQMYDAFRGGDLPKALMLQRQLFRLGDAMAACDHAAGKAALSMLGVCGDELTTPLRGMGEDDLSYLRHVLQELGLLAGQA
jgi:dihydrodipicolinate synthase/N-acetylneuraminate lyase